MLTMLDQVVLRDGRVMRVTCLRPPEPDIAPRFKEFMRYLGDESGRSLRARVDGAYAGCSSDRYLFASIEGRIVGQVWFGWGHHPRPVANFGNVYVDPEFRGLGITSILLRYWRREFDRSPAIGAFCTCSVPWIVALYRAVGFGQIVPGSSRLFCPAEGAAPVFTALAGDYYAGANGLQVQPATMEYRHEIDCLLAFYLEATAQRLPRVFVSSQVTGFQNALFRQEDGRGRVFVALAGTGCCIGWSFCLSPLADPGTVFLDYELHPAHADAAADLVARTLALWRAADPRSLYAACLPGTAKAKVFAAAGFAPVASLPGAAGADVVLLAEPQGVAAAPRGAAVT